jgi:hypothetical protein
MMMLIKRLVPTWAKTQLKKFLIPREYQKIEKEMGLYLLEKARDFSKDRGGIPEALNANIVKDCIYRQRCLSTMNEVHQSLQTAFVPRPMEHGPERTPDLTPDPAFTMHAVDFNDLAAQLGV